MYHEKRYRLIPVLDRQKPMREQTICYEYGLTTYQAVQRVNAGRARHFLWDVWYWGDPVEGLSHGQYLGVV